MTEVEDTEQEAPPADDWEIIDGGQFRPISDNPKYTTHEVAMDSGEHFLLKTTKGGNAEGDLGNSAAWSQEMRALNPQTFSTPRAYAALEERDGRFYAHNALFDWVDGGEMSEDSLVEQLGPLADIVQELSGFEVEWGQEEMSFPLRHSIKNSIEGLKGKDQDLGSKVGEIYGSNVDCLKPGVSHGDFAPKNMIIDTNGRIVLIDAEFGTHPGRPNFKLPRTHDAAYLLHLAVVKFDQSQTAELWLQELGERFEGDQTWEQEFWTSVIERTLAMYSNFVLNPKPGFDTDPRQREQEPYHRLLDLAADKLIEMQDQQASIT